MNALQPERLARSIRLIAALFAVLPLAALSGCGGGGGGTPAFTVTATATVGGAINPQSVRVAQGSQTTFTVTPSQGYSIQGVSC